MTTSAAKNKHRDELRIKVAETLCGEGGKDAANALLQAALDDGEITERQARNIAKFAAGVWQVRTQPVAQLVQDEAGHFLGEMTPLADGTWHAGRYGPDYAAGGVVVADSEAAERYITQSGSNLADSLQEIEQAGTP
jgi:hypothetical protein